MECSSATYDPADSVGIFGQPRVMQPKLRKRWLDSLAVLSVVFASGNPVVPIALGKEAVLVGLPLLLLGHALLRGGDLRRTDLRVLGLFATLGVLHLLTYGSVTISATLGFLLKLGAALLLVRFVPNSSALYVKVMVMLAVVSLAFFVPHVLTGYALRDAMAWAAIPYRPEVVHIGLHNFHLLSETHRNSGMFWEPGAFAGYLLLAIIMEVAHQAGVRNHIHMNRTLIVLGLTLLTTQSSTGYIALVVFSLGAIVAKYGIRYLGRLSLAGALLATVAGVAFLDLPFLSEKVLYQYESTLGGRVGHEINRIGNAKYDWDFIMRRPIIGWSATPETRSVVDPDIGDLVAGQGNGLTGFAVRFGLVGLLCYVGFVFGRLKQEAQSTLIAIAGTIAILMLLVGEQYLNFPVFLSLMFAIPRNRRLGTIISERSMRRGRDAFSDFNNLP